MTAPQPSTPEEFATYVSEFLGVFGDFGPIIDATRFRDAAVRASVSVEIETAWLKRLDAAEAEVARLREALEQAHRYATGQAFRILTDALAEGQP